MSKTPAKTKPAAKMKKSPAPAPIHVLSPHLVCRDASAAITFYKKAFGAEKLMRLPTKDGKLMHARLLIHGASVLLVDEMPDWGVLSPLSLKGSPVTLHLYVDDCDAAVERAAKAGATVKMAPADMFWGDRYGMVVDPFGHNWSFAKHLKAMTPAEIKAAMGQMMPGH